jgi:hypothetical protein
MCKRLEIFLLRDELEAKKYEYDAWGAKVVRRKITSRRR